MPPGYSGSTSGRPTLRQEHLEQQATVRIAELERRCAALTSENSDLQEKLALRPSHPPPDALSAVLPLRAKVSQLEAGLESAKRWNAQLVAQRDTLLAEVEQLRGWTPGPRTAGSPRKARPAEDAVGSPAEGEDAFRGCSPAVTASPDSLLLPGPDVLRQPASWDGDGVAPGSPRKARMPCDAQGSPKKEAKIPSEECVGSPASLEDPTQDGEAAAGGISRQVTSGRMSPPAGIPPFAPGTWTRATGGPPPRVSAARMPERALAGKDRKPVPLEPTSPSGSESSGDSRSVQSVKSEVWETDGTTSLVKGASLVVDTA